MTEGVVHLGASKTAGANRGSAYCLHNRIIEL